MNATRRLMEIAFFTQHMMVMGDFFFFNEYEEEYPNCKFPAFNLGKAGGKTLGYLSSPHAKIIVWISASPDGECLRNLDLQMNKTF
jgi:hypothetical protein